MLKQINALPIGYWLPPDANVEFIRESDGYFILVNDKPVIRLTPLCEASRGKKFSLSIADECCDPKLIDRIMRPSTYNDDSFMHTNKYHLEN